MGCGKEAAVNEADVLLRGRGEPDFYRRSSAVLLTPGLDAHVVSHCKNLAFP